MNRRALATALGHPDTSTGIPEVRRVRAMIFERLVRDGRFVSQLLTTAVGALGLERPVSVRRVDSGVAVDRTAKALAQAQAHLKTVHESAATMITGLALPFVGMEHEPRATPVKPDFAIVVPRAEHGSTPADSWLIMGDSKDYERHHTRYDSAGSPTGADVSNGRTATSDVRIAILATRNQAVDDAQSMAERLTDRHQLPESVIVASTVDSWQGQTNDIHPLSAASELNDFNSAFGRLAVTCTRAARGLLLVSPAGLDELLSAAPARPGTPLGEPGTRQMPRQTHGRTLSAFARMRISSTRLLPPRQA